MSKKTVFLYRSGDEQIDASLLAILAALDCVELTDDAKRATVQVVAIVPSLMRSSAVELLRAAADRAVRIIGVRTGPDDPVPDVLALAARRIVAMTAEELYDAICLDASGPSGGDGFPPRPHPCGTTR